MTFNGAINGVTEDLLAAAKTLMVYSLYEPMVMVLEHLAVHCELDAWQRKRYDQVLEMALRSGAGLAIRNLPQPLDLNTAAKLMKGTRMRRRQAKTYPTLPANVALFRPRPKPEKPLVTNHSYAVDILLKRATALAEEGSLHTASHVISTISEMPLSRQQAEELHELANAVLERIERPLIAATPPPDAG